MMQDELGDRQKMYERVEAGRKLMPLLPALARIDGRSFSSFTRRMERPYDLKMSRAMIETTKALVKGTGAVLGYTQSDEISLCWLQTNYESEIFFAGKIQKMVSQLAAQATVIFNDCVRRTMEPVYAEKYPTFDARVWNVPTLDEAANCFRWRELDASKNSVSMLARCHFSHKELFRKSSRDMRAMLMEKGVDWSSYPAFFTRGTFIRTKKVRSKVVAEDLALLPEKHSLRLNPDLEIDRTIIEEISFPPLAKEKDLVATLFPRASLGLGGT